MRIAISDLGKGRKFIRGDLVRSLQEMGHQVCRIGQVPEGNHVHPEYEQNRVEYIGIPLKRTNTNPFKELGVIREARSALSKAGGRSLIIYGIRTFPSMVIAAKLSGVKQVLCIVNGTGRLFRIRGARGFALRLVSFPLLWFAFLLSNHVIFQNKDDLRLVRRKGLLWRSNYSIVNGSGVNLERFSVVGFPSEPAFTMIARLTGSKGVNEYVRAAVEVRKQHPEAQFYLVGPMDNDDRSVDIELLRDATNKGIVMMVGEVDDVRPYIEKTRVFVLPSYHEGTPRTVLEAMAMGRPIITTDAPGCRETVEEGINGFKVPVSDVRSLVDRIIWMIENPDAVEEMGRNSRRICEEKYDVHKINSVIIERLGVK